MRSQYNVGNFDIVDNVDSFDIVDIIKNVDNVLWLYNLNTVLGKGWQILKRWIDLNTVLIDAGP